MSMRRCITGRQPAHIGKGECEEVKEWYVDRSDSGYPRALRCIAHAPERIYIRGCLPDERLPCAAVIGARRCSSYGREMAQWFAGELAAAGVQVISGMALGVDGIAQRAALAAGGKSFGVLGSGTDVCYPRDNRDLYERLLEQGGVLSEYPAGTPPLPVHFPWRNRIISALADVILVIEAKEKSGTLITVDFALEQGKDVYVLPGRVTDALSCGCNRLLCQGAGAALSPHDVVEALYRKHGAWEASDRGLKASGDGLCRLGSAGEAEKLCTEETCGLFSCGMEEKERLVWEQMGERPFTLQQLYEKINASAAGKDMSLQETMEILINFIMRDMIIQGHGNQYERKRSVSSI